MGVMKFGATRCRLFTTDTAKHPDGQHRTDNRPHEAQAKVIEHPHEGGRCEATRRIQTRAGNGRLDHH